MSHLVKLETTLTDGDLIEKVLREQGFSVSMDNGVITARRQDQRYNVPFVFTPVQGKDGITYSFEGDKGYDDKLINMFKKNYNVANGLKQAPNYQYEYMDRVEESDGTVVVRFRDMRG